jgi:hypothetical protein
MQKALFSLSLFFPLVRQGFRPSSAYEQLGMDAAVVLSNSMSCADLPRINDGLVRSGFSLNR